MRKIIIFTLFTLFPITALTIKAQGQIAIDLQNSDIEGRWIETERITYDQQIADEQRAIFVFKTDSTYYKGAEVDNMIIFAISGKYIVKNDSINISCFDFTNKYASTQRLRKMWMKVISYSKDEIRVQVRESRYNKYEAVLKRQEF